ncbi:MAG: PTS sugar transporter subunit IIB [Deltaproteobacteria bacterium]|jgi:mannose/fructose/N-acetylgalactosamine-specific phosphotransferase system component IIB|nr:PTS sugar transporter subunit IIB [Deltaproteobacteria bacterium]
MPVVLTRIDHKLVHGQILSGWVDHLKINKIVVVDEEIINQEKIMEIFSSALTDNCQISFRAPSDLSGELQDCLDQRKRCLILFKDLQGARDTIKFELDQYGKKPFESLNLGNYAPKEEELERIEINKSFSVTKKELENLRWIANQGIKLYSQSVPNDTKIIVDLAKLNYPRP